MKEMILGIMRHLLTTAGGAGVAAGHMTESDSSTMVGAVLALVGIGLSIYNKKKGE